MNILKVHLGEVTQRKKNMYTHTLTHIESIKNKDFRTWSPHTERLEDLLALS